MTPLVDLHLHTTASDGRATPRDLLDRCTSAGLAVMAVTDHDTMAAVRDLQALGEERGISVVPGIEITAVEDGRDVHVLGYFLDPDEPGLVSFLDSQRSTRVHRVRTIGERLAALGMPIDVERLLAEAAAQSGKSIGRPKVARAMVTAGYVADIREAFDKWLTPGCPAFVERAGASVERVIGIVHRAGGLVSLAHPGRTRLDARIPKYKEAGLDALEVYHTDHDGDTVTRYAAVARSLGLLMTGGSDYHGDPAHGVEPGSASLPPDEWNRLAAARHRHAVG